MTKLFKAALVIFTLALGNLKAQESINFKKTNYDEFIKEAKQIRKPVLIYFTGRGCALCANMERQVFPKPEVYQLYNTSFINIESYLDLRKADPETLKLRRKYGIEAQPTFVFIDSTGAVIHKSGFQETDGFIKVGKQALGNDNYRGWLQQFSEGKYDVETVQKFLEVETKPVVYAEVDYKCKAQEVLDAYFNSIPEGTYTTETNWRIIETYVANPYSKVFQYFLKNQHLFEQLYGIEAVNKKIYSVYDWAWAGNMGSSTYKNAEKMIKESEHPMAKLLIKFRQMGEEGYRIIKNQSDWKAFVAKYNTDILNHNYIVNPNTVYEILDDLNSRSVKDVKSLTSVNKWMGAVLKIKDNEDVYYYSCYAKSFYLLGNKKAAINAQNKVIEIARSTNLDQSTIEEYRKVLAGYKK